MTDAAWLKCSNPVRMLAYLGSIPAYRPGRPTSRKLRLFACAAVRMVWAQLTDGSCRMAVEVAEQFADGLVGADELNAAREAALRAWQRTCGPEQIVFKAAHKTAGWDAALAAEDTVAELCRFEQTIGPVQCALLRDITGNPFRRLMPLSPSLRYWHDGLIVRLAEAIYQERSLPAGTLDVARLGVLADALEEAGCADTDLLDHLRGPGLTSEGAGWWTY
jgi:hypothetical protein